MLIAWLILDKRIVIPWTGPADLAYIEFRGIELDPFVDRFSTYRNNFDYFIITNMGEFRRQEDLFRELSDHYPVHAEGGGYIIFDLETRSD